MSKEKKIFISSLFLCSTYGMYTFVIHGGNNGFYDGKAKLWKYLTLWDNGTEGIFFIIVMMLSMLGIVFHKYRQTYNKFDQNCILRIGLKKYMINNIKNIVFESIVFMSILHTVLLMFDFIYFKDPIFAEYADYCYIVNDQLWNMVLFLILSIIGMTIFNIFIYSLSIFIHNIYIFAVLPIIVIFVTLMMSDVFVQLLGPAIDYIAARIIFLSLVPSALIQPGSSMDYPLITYTISLIFYICLSFLAFKYTLNKRNKEG